MTILLGAGAGLFLLLAQGCSKDHDGAALQPPPGYLLAAPAPSGKPHSCPAVPVPYTGELYFPSKYSGSDAARDQINPQAAARYAQLTADVRNLENGVNKLVARYLHDGQPASVDCALAWLSSWAEADALLSTHYNHTGKSVRKWALGSVAGAYLRLKFSRSQPLAGHGAEAKRIEGWIARLADQVVRDWNAQPLERRNNHQYWAAWSVMASAVILDRRDLFDWAVAQYRQGMSQVDGEGYLPRELSRQTRALAYHNYSMGPLLMIAAFAEANGLDLREENADAMQRLAQRLESGLHDPKIFQEKTGYPQTLEDLQDSNRFAWLEPYCALYPCSQKTEAWRRSLEPLDTYRLGGDMTQLFSRHLP
ncbi:poly(beta-D-mannuronate) lyase [Pseudomonas alcaligenes]|uniref:Poly(Beta-D-mannuronate) lyase n=1 Tax=Aquipseudomonas alcaligenes TaxID=43263 RepID=A0ABR7RZ00_AQUAC|nr:mannuronate-specific alginate lyase [Pseudomonas alcaligenes]MBC9250536.1 poly(beta-D-mannuronate) lyase [Pseudomonas alcaligenes]